MEVNYTFKRYREDWVLNNVVGPDVLDIGCAGMVWELDWNVDRHRPIYERLYDKFGAYGWDNDGRACYQLSKKGYPVLCADVERAGEYAVERIHDTIVLGDIIEHLGNPSKALTGLLKHGKRIVLTTPNRLYGWSWIAYGILGRKEDDPHHMFWSSMPTIKNLLERSGWKVEHIEYLLPDPGNRKGLGLLKYVPEYLIPRIRPTIGVIAVNNGDS